MLKVFVNKTDSEIFGRNVVDIEVPNNIHNQFEQIENEIISKWSPFLINAFVQVDDLKVINWFTCNRYQFIETRLHVTKEITEHFSTRDLYPYEFNRLNDPKELEDLLSRCLEMSFDDRYSSDPLIDKQLALKRNIFFLRQSFGRDNEPIFILNNRHNPGILGFRSVKLESPVEAAMLLSGVVNHPMTEKFRAMINLFELEQLAKMDIQYIKAVISVRNFSEINHYVSQFKYQIVNVQFVCRKLL